MNERVRAAIYRLAVAIFVLLVARGVVLAEEAPLWLDIISSVLGLGTAALATAHTSMTNDSSG